MMLFSFPAMAQNSQLTPVHGWLTGSATPGQGSVNSKCMIFNQFSDGTLLRLSVSENSIETLTVIFRDNLFDPISKNNYPAMLQTSASFRDLTDGYAYSPYTLSVTPSNAQAFYNELMTQRTLRVSLEQGDYTFRLEDLSEQLDVSKTCQRGETVVRTSVNLNGTKEVKIFADLKLPRRNTLTSDSVWRAKRGERVGDVVARWARESGRRLPQPVERNAIMTNDFIYQGAYTNAVEKLNETAQ